VASERVASSELEELAQDAGGSDLPRADGIQVTARLAAASKIQEGQEAELWFDARHLQLFDSEAGHSLLASGGNGASAGQAAAAAAPPGAAAESEAEAAARGDE
jgi:hypothetical protein